MAIRETIHDMAQHAQKHGNPSAAIGQSVAQAAQSAEKAMHQVVEKGSESLQEQTPRLAEQASQLTAQATDDLDDLRAHVRRNSLISTAIAFGAGLLIARLVLRR